MKSILSGIKLLREANYYHNDIHAWNVMVDLETQNTYLYDLGRASPIEHENTITAILWVIYQLQHMKTLDCMKMQYPLSKKPVLELAQLDVELQEITRALLAAESIDAYFKHASTLQLQE